MGDYLLPVSALALIMPGTSGFGHALGEDGIHSHNGHITGVRETSTAIWQKWLHASGRTALDSPSLDRHHYGFDPRTGNGGVTIWIPIEV